MGVNVKLCITEVLGIVEHNNSGVDADNGDNLERRRTEEFANA
jgi:hypothetical protein